MKDYGVLRAKPTSEMRNTSDFVAFLCVWLLGFSHAQYGKGSVPSCAVRSGNESCVVLSFVEAEVRSISSDTVVFM